MPSVVSDIIEVCVFRRAGNGPEVLLLRRAPDETLYPGVWQIVTGAIDKGENAVDAARRELREETGVAPMRFWTVPWVSSFYEPARDLLHVMAFFAAEAAPDAEIRLSSEHDRSEWLPFHEASGRLVWPAQRQGLEVVRKYILGDEPAAGYSELRF